MNIIVFTKRVPATQEEELRILDDGQKVDLSKMPFKVNDWDNYAVEEGVRLVEKSGGSLAAVTIGDAESDEVLRRAIAMGARDGYLLEAGQTPQDPSAKADVAAGFLKKENLPFDLIFTGVQAEDDQFGAVGAILAAKLGLPYCSMVIGIDGIEQGRATLRRELEGGLQERVSIALPCVLAIQSGINEPRYVSIMGVRKASKVERKVFKAEQFGGGEPAVEVVRWLYPPKKGGAIMLTGELEGACREMLAILKEKGVFQ